MYHFAFCISVGDAFKRSEKKQAAHRFLWGSLRALTRFTNHALVIISYLYKVVPEEALKYRLIDELTCKHITAIHQ